MLKYADAGTRGPAPRGQLEEAAEDLSLMHGAGFAVAVVGIMLAEQTLMNASVLIVNAQSGRALAGFVFNVMLIVRAPLQLFQAIQTSILPHLAGLEARESQDEFHHAIRITILAIAAFSGAVALGLLIIGPAVMTALLGDKGFHYGRFGLALVGLGMGLHLVSGTLNQAALARNAREDRRDRLAGRGGRCSSLFVALPTISAEVTRVEVGYFGAALGALRPAEPASTASARARRRLRRGASSNPPPLPRVPAAPRAAELRRRARGSTGRFLQPPAFSSVELLLKLAEAGGDPAQRLLDGAAERGGALLERAGGCVVDRFLALRHLLLYRCAVFVQLGARPPTIVDSRSWPCRS